MDAKVSTKTETKAFQNLIKNCPLVSLSLFRENLREMRVLFLQNPSLSQKKEIHFFKYNNFLNYYINFNLFHYIRSKAKSKAKKARICGPKGFKGAQRKENFYQSATDISQPKAKNFISKGQKAAFTCGSQAVSFQTWL